MLSRPRYPPLAIDPAARSHLLVIENVPLAGDAFESGSGIDGYDEVWTITGDSRTMPSPDTKARSQEFRSARHMLIALNRRLQDERMGFRLHAVGTEGFLWKVANLAESFGMSGDQYRLYHAGSAARRVFCIHCRTTSAGVTTNIAVCTGCRARLLVRDHFSRRLNAFMGVQADAEIPGELPSVVTMYE